MRVGTMIACALWLMLVTIVAGHAEKRVALVIGNGAYERADRLANPVTDARRMRDALSKLGFNVVFGENLGKLALERMIGRFADTVQDADVALVFYSGHGATFGDTPYVVPVDAQFSSLRQVPYELVPVETLIGELRQAKGLRIAILDACRDDTAERELKRTAARGGEITRGLMRVKNPEGLILAYATQYLSTAADNGPNGDSPFTAALLNNIATPGLDVKDLFFKVGREVIATTRGKQRPEISVSFYESYALVPAPSVPSADPAAKVWAVTQNTTSIAVLDDFIRQFGDTPYASLARARREALVRSEVTLEGQEAALSPRPPEAPDSFVAPPAPALDVRRFDGNWLVSVLCPRTAILPGWAFQFVGNVKDGVFHAQRHLGNGQEDVFEGTVEANGTTNIFVKGTSGDTATDHFHRPKGTQFQYGIIGKLEGSAGTATRADRDCTIRFTRQSVVGATERSGATGSSRGVRR